MFYMFVRLLLTPIALLYNRLTVHFKDRIPEKGAYIIVANHVSYLDPIYIGLSVKRKLYYMAKKETFNNPLLGWIITKLGAFPVTRDKADIRAVKTELSILKEGKLLAVFPQGGRRSEDELTDIKQGAAYFAIKTNTPIIPLYIKGTDEVMPKGQGMIKPKKVEVFIGEPIDVPLITKTNKNEILEIMTNKVKKQINNLAKQSA